MAKCDVIEEKPLPPPKTYVLTLNENEAQAVLTLASNLSYDTWAEMGAYHLRAGSLGVYRVLRDAGVSSVQLEGRGPLRFG